MQSRHLFVSAAVLGLISIFAVKAYAENISMREFVQKASVAGMFEVESSKLALKKSQNTTVKTFARRMVEDHTKANNRLKSTLKAADSDVKPATKLDNKHQNLLNKLQSASGDDFDDKYISIQTDAHKEAVDLFSEYAENGKDPAVQNFAEETLPTLKEHLEHVRKLEAN